MSKRKREYDPNIAKALQEIKWPILNHKGKPVRIRKTARNENGFEHIAGKMHQLKIRDIELVPSIISSPLKIICNNRGRKGKAYFGKRKGVNKSPYLKIVVRLQEHGIEEIVTIYSVKSF